MIAKILANSTSYSGIDYNDNKVVKGVAELLYAENFGWLESGIIDCVEAFHYKKYLDEWDKRNTRVDNKQFHVTISAKGKYATKEQLLSIGREWMKQMGYEGQPTIYYFHGDTRNNHIHILSSRIGRDGKKIDDRNERWRARSIINSICENDIHQKCRDDVANATRYRFESIKQFEAILLSLGYNSKLNGDQLEVWREGESLLSINVDLVKHNFRTKPVNDQRLTQIKALFYKYSKSMSIKDFKDLMKSTFGLSVIFFGKSDMPYGYTVVDNIDKAVYKGGDIMNLKMLMHRQTDFIEKIRSILEIEFKREQPKGTYELNGILKMYGVALRGVTVVWKSNGLALIELSNEQIDKLSYGNKLAMAQRFSLCSEEELKLVAHMYGVNSSHLRYDPNIVKDYDAVRELINSCGGDSLRDNVAGVGMKVVDFNDEKFVVDSFNNQIYEYNKLGLVESRFTSLHEVDALDEDLIRLPTLDEHADNQHLGGGVNNELPKRKRR